jgi:Tol biopolymer transport system component
VWSPDGSKLALVAATASVPHLEVITAGGEVLWSLANSDCPTWSPDGRMLAFDRLGGSGEMLFVVGSNGRGPHKIASDIEGVSRAWSPDATEIAYVSATNAEDGPPVATLVRVDGSGHRQVKLTPDTSWCNAGCRIHYPQYGLAWAPANDLAVLLESGDQYPVKLYAVRPDSSNQRLLSGSLQEVFAPAWSPDGTRIAFQGRKGSTDQIWTAKADGNGARQLTHIISKTSNLSGVTLPSWSPSGKEIACAGHAGGIYIIDATTGTARLLARDGDQGKNSPWADIFGGTVSWQPRT